MKPKTVYTVGKKEFPNPEEAIKYEADQYGEALKNAGHSGPGLQRKVNAVEEFLAYQEFEILPEVKAKRVSKKEKGSE